MSASGAEKTKLVTVTIDGIQTQVPAGTLVIRAAEQIGVQIPRFCDHPLLEPVGACRQCLVEVVDAGGAQAGRAMPKPQASCTIPVAEGMVVNTQATSAVAAKAQEGIMEFLLINHPLDCPICDKGGECPLQNQAMSNGRAESRFSATGGIKRVYPKPINISDQILLDRERCVLCARCTRFSEQIAGDPFITLVERGSYQQVGTFNPDLAGIQPLEGEARTEGGQPFDSYFSGNTIQICPVGALTSADYRFRSRPFDLVSTPSIAEHDACGAAIRVDHRRGKVMRRQAGDDPEVNEEWITDKDRFAFTYARMTDRLTHPLVRDEESGQLRAASWSEAFAVAARGLKAANAAGVLTGGRLTAEDSYAYAKFARVALGTNDIDFRARAHSEEEAAFLAAHVVLSREVTYGDLETAKSVLLVALEPEDEAGTIFLRLRKAHRKHRTSVWSVAPFTSRGSRKLDAHLLPARPGAEVEVVSGLASGDSGPALGADAVILVGERAVETPGLLGAVAELATKTGARLAWVPRRAGDRGALETGALGNLLPGGRPVADAAARVDLAAAWGVDDLPSAPGRSTAAIVAAAAAGQIGGLVVAGVDPADLPDPEAMTTALQRAFVVSLELRESAVTAAADVVFPVAPVTDRSGTFVNWEGRLRSFETVLRNPASIPDLRVLAGIAEEMGSPIRIRTTEQAFAEMTEIGPWDGERPQLFDAAAGPSTGSPSSKPGSATGQGAHPALVLASWKQMLDDGRMQDGERHLRATARPPVVLAPQALLDGLGIVVGDEVTLTGPRGAVTLPVGVADLVDGVVWAPATAPGLSVRDRVGPPGSAVSIGRVTHVPAEKGAVA